MAYRELIKDFEHIRDYMREFYLYGFKSRGEYRAKSLRSYDNERRRVESWLGSYMNFRQDSGGKNVFLSVDSRQIQHNPFYKAFKAKSFTSKDITLHFYILDILADGQARPFREIVERIYSDYLSRFPNGFPLDESTVRKKLEEYKKLGLLQKTRRGREVLYQRTCCGALDLGTWADALAFYSEAAPLGVIGSFLVDKLETSNDLFRFKHHYILHALDSDVLYQLLLAIDQQRSVELTVRSLRGGGCYRRTVCPLKIYVSTQGGRQYLLGHYGAGRRMVFFRLDAIQKVAIGERDEWFDAYLKAQARFDRHLWGVSTGAGRGLEHIEMTVRFEPGEEFVAQRLEREKRHGRVERLDAHTCRFSADVYDAMEMLPWLRTFTGRIVKLQCSNPSVTERFYEDLERMRTLYRRRGDAVQ